MKSKMYHMRVVGTTFIEGVQDLLKVLRVCVDTRCILLKLVSEKGNIYDNNAVRVELSVRGMGGKYKKIGYIPKSKSKYVTDLLSNSIDKFVIKDVFLYGGVYDYENVGIGFNFYITKR